MKRSERQLGVRVGLMGLCAQLSVLPAAAALLMYEGFDMEPGELDGRSGASAFGWRMAGSEQMPWSAVNPAGAELPGYHEVVADGLSYPWLQHVDGAFAFRNEAVQASNAAHRMMTGFLHYYLTGERWISALLTAKIDGDPSGGGWFQFCLSDPIARHGSIYFGISNNSTRDQTHWSAGGERVYIDGVHGEKWSVSDVPVAEGEPVLMVMQLDFTNKTAAWWINPPVDADDPGEPVDRFELLTDLYVDRVMLRIFNNGPSQQKEVPDFPTQGVGADYTGSRVDEIRIGTTYASVVPVDPDYEPEHPPIVSGDAAIRDLQVLRSGGQLLIRFANTVAGSFQLESSADLGATDPWVPVSGQAATSVTAGEAQEFTVPLAEQVRFYRIAYLP